MSINGPAATPNTTPLTHPTAPKIAFGMPLYNGQAFLPQAIESLLCQTHKAFRLFAVDDGSGDATDAIMKRYASQDSRILYERNPARRGLIYTWRRVFLNAAASGIDYFAWVSDHDLWHPDWLKYHLEVLNTCPEVVMTYPLMTAIGPDNQTLFKTDRGFDTFGMKKLRRVHATCKHIYGCGNMIYGLFRAGPVQKAGIFPQLTMPDRLLLLQLSVHGAYKLIPRNLWFRRFPRSSDSFVRPNYGEVLNRQGRTLYGDGRCPWYAGAPVSSHVFALFFRITLCPRAGDYSHALFGPLMALLYLRRKRGHVIRELKAVWASLLLSD